MPHSHNEKKRHKKPARFTTHNTAAQAQPAALRCKPNPVHGFFINTRPDRALRLEIQREVERAIG